MTRSCFIQDFCVSHAVFSAANMLQSDVLTSVCGMLGTPRCAIAFYGHGTEHLNVHKVLFVEIRLPVCEATLAADCQSHSTDSRPSTAAGKVLRLLQLTSLCVASACFQLLLGMLD